MSSQQQKPQRPLGPRPVIDCAAPLWVPQKDPNKPLPVGYKERNSDNNNTPSPTSSISADATPDRLGIYQQDLHVEGSKPRTIIEASFHHALEFGGAAGLLVELVQDYLPWFNHLFFRGGAIEVNWELLVKKESIDSGEYEAEHYVYAYLLQHHKRIWQAINLGELPRLEDEEWNNNYIKRKMQLGLTPGVYLNAIAMKRNHDDKGKLTEISGRLGTVDDFRDLLERVKQYAFEDRQNHDGKMRKEIDEVFYKDDNDSSDSDSDSDNEDLYPRFLTEGNRGLRLVKAHFKDFVDWVTLNEWFIDSQKLSGDAVITRCIQECGMTSGPLASRGYEHLWNVSTTHVNGLLNAIMYKYQRPLYGHMRQYAVVEVFDPHHPKGQAMGESLVHLVGQTTIEGGAGPNIKMVTVGRKPKVISHYKEALANQFDADMCERYNDEIIMYRRMTDACSQYVPGVLQRNLEAQAELDKQLEEAKERNAKLKQQLKEAHESKDRALAEKLNLESEQKKTGDSWLKLKASMTAYKEKFERERDAIKPTPLRKNPKVLPFLYTEQEALEDQHSAGSLKALEGQGDDYMPPPGWTVKEEKGKFGEKVFVDSEGFETSMPPHRLDAMIKRGWDILDAGLNPPGGSDAMPPPPLRGEHGRPLARAEMEVELRYLCRDQIAKRKEDETTEERRAAVLHAMEVLDLGEPPSHLMPKQPVSEGEDYFGKDDEDGDEDDEEEDEEDEEEEEEL